MFQIYRVEAHSVTFVTIDENINCIQICHKLTEMVCDERRDLQDPYIEIKSLLSFTQYKFYISGCDGLQTLSREFTIQTKRDSKFS